MTRRDSKFSSNVLFRLLRGWRSAVAVFALIAQLGFLAHQAEHHLNLDLVGSDDCAMCQFGTAMAPPPEAAPLPAPAIVFVAAISRPPQSRAPRTRIATAFRSRAPPISFI